MKGMVLDVWDFCWAFIHVILLIAMLIGTAMALIFTVYQCGNWGHTAGKW